MFLLFAMWLFVPRRKYTLVDHGSLLGWCHVSAVLSIPMQVRFLWHSAARLATPFVGTPFTICMAWAAILVLWTVETDKCIPC